MRVTTAKDFGYQIREASKKAKLTQAQLAAASGLGERFVRELKKALLVANMLGIHFNAELPSFTKE